MLSEIVSNLRVLCDYKVNELAVLNILQAKLTYVFSLKDVKFKSIQNIGEARPLAYYAFNFVPSGGMKNLPPALIDKHLIGFVNDFLFEYNNERIKKIECEQTMEMNSVSDKIERRRKTQEYEQILKEEKKKRLELTLTNATQAKIYSNLDIINQVGYGAICIQNTEFVNFYEEAILNRDKIKKEFLYMLYDLYDGEYKGTDTVSVARKNLYNIPISCVLLSDYKLFSENEKLGNNFKSYLSRGMARRSFIYFRENENYYKKNHVYPSYDKKQQAIDNLKIYSQKIKQIFDNIELHKEYIFNGEANERINEYKKEVDAKICEFYKYTDKLTNNNEILKLNIEHSTWKIIKLAVLYHIIDTGGAVSFVKADSFNKAINFFNETHHCLDMLLNDKTISDYDNLYNYLIENRNKWISKTELRNQKFVNNRDFKTWLEDAFIAISVKADEKGFLIAQRAVGKRNQGVEFTLYEPKLYSFKETEKLKDGRVKGELICLDNRDMEVSEI